MLHQASTTLQIQQLVATTSDYFALLKLTLQICLQHAFVKISWALLPREKLLPSAEIARVERLFLNTLLEPVADLCVVALERLEI